MNAKINYMNKVQEIAESQGWNVEIQDNIVTFQRYSTYGQDFSFSLDVAETSDEFVDNLYNYYSEFDVSYEAYLWLDNTGHGTNGAPYEMIDVYNDMAECEAEICELWRKIYDVDFDSIIV